MKQHPANAVTISRIVFSLSMLFTPVFSAAFYVFYIIAGLTDALDGAVARCTGTVSGFGAKLDTAADIVFTAVCLIRVLPVIELPAWAWSGIALTALIKAVNIGFGYAMHRGFISLHTAMNRLTGLLLFLFPFTAGFLRTDISAAVLIAAALFAAVQEGHWIRTGR